jgi:glycosyltransferase involved in cell wall biosynthesis
LKLIHTIPTINEEASGPSYSVVRLCEVEIALGAQVTLTAIDRNPSSSIASYMKVFPYGLGPKKLGRSPEMYSWLKSQTKEKKVDLIHNHSLWMMPNVYPKEICQRAGVPLIISPRGTLSDWAMQSGSLIKKIFWPLVQGPVLSSATCFHATAYSEYEDIRRLGFRQPVAVIPNGIDIGALQKNNSNERTLLFLGRIHPKKGIEMLLQAWRMLQSQYPEWRLQIVGPDNEGHLDKMIALAKKLDLKRVKFCGPLYGKEKNQAYSDADLFVLPTYSENFGMSVAEALAAGTPVVVSKGAPWAEINQKNAGWWVDINTEGLLAGLKDGMSKSPNELLKMGYNGKLWMQAEYSWLDIGKRMLKTYEWVLQGGVTPEWILQD